MVWERKSKAHHEPPKVAEEPEELASDDWSETTPDAQVYDLLVEETPDPREEGAAPVDTYVARPRREEAPPEI
jgi:hypothetical protein